MNTVQGRFPSWISVPATIGCRVAHAARPAPQAKPLQASAEDSARFLRIMAECAHIRRHFDIFRWLQGEVQHFLPHEILLSAWGDFGVWDVELDLISGLPGVRTGQLAHCQGVDALVRRAYALWTRAERSPIQVKVADTEMGQYDCHCPIHVALRGMRSFLVHGVHDKRSGHDSLFIALRSGLPGRESTAMPHSVLAEPLFAQIDTALRKVAAFPLAEARCAAGERGNALGLTGRELEVLEAVCRGKTNLDIAAMLEISPFTVKNHVQRIFRKIGVTNRTQAAARYAAAERQTAVYLGRRAQAAQTPV